MESTTLAPLSTIKIVNSLLPSTKKTSPQKRLHPNPKLVLKNKSPSLTHYVSRTCSDSSFFYPWQIAKLVCSAKPPNTTNEGIDLGPRIEGEAKPISDPAVSSPSIPSLSRGLVLDLGHGDSWDNVEIGSPVVKRYLSDEEERWYLWYHGRSSKNPDSDSIGLAVSSNGVHWERGLGGVKSSGDVGLVMGPSQDWWGFDTQNVRPTEVSIMSSTKLRANSGVYWLYYTGFTSEKVEFSHNSNLDFRLENPERVYSLGTRNIDPSMKHGEIYKSLPGLAMSQDGRHWARIEGEHHSGALFDVGKEGEWDSLFIASPHVVFHGNGDLRMYYHSFDPENGCFAIGMARSRDGIKWVKLGKIIGGGGGAGEFDEVVGAMEPNVVRNKRDGNYVMAYEGVGLDGRRRIGMAVSSDGLKGWRRVGGGLKECEEEDGWDSEGVGSPCLVQMDGDEDCQWRLYYRGVGRGGRTGIGMAVSNANDFQGFQRWTGFHL